jgi:hypothetical protein
MAELPAHSSINGPILRAFPSLAASQDAPENGVKQWLEPLQRFRFR